MSSPTQTSTPSWVKWLALGPILLLIAVVGLLAGVAVLGGESKPHRRPAVAAKPAAEPGAENQSSQPAAPAAPTPGYVASLRRADAKLAAAAERQYWRRTGYYTDSMGLLQQLQPAIATDFPLQVTDDGHGFMFEADSVDGTVFRVFALPDGPTQFVCGPHGTNGCSDSGKW